MTEINKGNPQKTISKEWIVGALIELMKKKPFKQINVTELSLKAGVARRTFYRHFKTTDEVLDYCLQKMCDDYISFILNQPRFETNLPKGTLWHFTYWEKHKDFLYLLKNNDLLLLLLHNFLTRYSEKIRQMAVSKETEFLICFIIGGQWNLLIKWIEDGAAESPQEMADMAENISTFLGKGA